MRLIESKMNNINSDAGYLYAEEANSIIDELSNLVKRRQTLKDDVNDQVLKSIILESKNIFYKDNGDVNAVDISVSEDPDYKLIDGTTYLFSPKEDNTGNVTIKVNKQDAVKLLLSGKELKSGYLKTTDAYIAVYRSATEAFEIKSISGSSNKSNIFEELEDSEIADDLIDNDVVYINQDTDILEKSIKEEEAGQKQNAIGIFKIIDDRKFIFYTGKIDNFMDDIVPGVKYYLSTENTGEVTTDDTSGIVVGRGIRNKGFIIDITGDVGINTVTVTTVVEYDTYIADDESANGNSFTDPSETARLNFDKIDDIDGSVPTVVMYASANDETVKIDYASEYEGNDLRVVIDDIGYYGTFEENEDYDNPTVLEER